MVGRGSRPVSSRAPSQWRWRPRRKDDDVIMIVPPLTITREELDEGLAVLDEVLAIADKYAG